MTTSYPTSLDAFTRPQPTDTMNSPSHAGVHDNAYDAVEALEAKVGIDASTVKTSLDWLTRWHGARIHLTSAQTATSGVVTTVSGYTVAHQASGETWYSAGSPTRLTIPTGFPTGLYVVEFSVSITQDDGGTRRFAGVYNNGVTVDIVGHHHRPATSASGGGVDLITGSTHWVGTAGDYFELVVLHDEGDDGTILQGNQNTWLACYFQGRS